MKNSTLSGKMPKQNLFVEIIASLLLIFFVHTLISSYIQLQSLKNLLGFYTSNTSVVAWTIIIVEFITFLLLLIPRTRLFGFLITIFCSIFAGYLVVSNPHLPHDFGGIINFLPWKIQFLLCSLLSILSGVGIFLMKVKPQRQKTDTPEPMAFT